jgi:hypothetical protein
VQRTRCRQLVIAAVAVAGVLFGAGSPTGAIGNRSDDWKVLEEAFEIIDISSVMTDPSKPVKTYKSSGANPVPDEVWRDYTPPLPYIKNTTRNLQFNESQFLASPGEPLGSTRYVTTFDGYTWGAMSEAINALWPYDPSRYSGPSAINQYFAGNLEVTPGPGIVKITANYKAQNMKFWANEAGAAPGSPGAVPLERYFITDQWGNEYVMHASGELDQADVADAFDRAVLPAGWTKSVRTLQRDLILRPAAGSDGSYHYLVVRDSADNTYHQTGWSSRGSLSAQVSGMPIWGGEGRDVLRGDETGPRADRIHGAGGNDLVLPGLGDDEVWGDAGTDTVVLSGRRSEWSVRSSVDDPTTVILVGPAGTKHLHHIELVRFDDRTVPVIELARADAR